MKRNYLFLSLMGLAAFTAICVAALTPSHVVRARSGWSGRSFWLAFDSQPTERQLYDALSLREPDPSDFSGLTKAPNPPFDPDAWLRKKQGYKREIPYAKIDNQSSLLLIPFEAGGNFDIDFGNGSGVKAIWLTEPSTRTEFTPLATRTAYFFVTLSLGFVAAFLTTKTIEYLINNLLFALVAAGLFLAVFAPVTEGKHARSGLPYAYFEILRCCVCGVACFGAFKLKDRRGWLWAMVAVAILFNPIFPARFSRQAWQVMDVAAGIFFLVSISLFSKKPASVTPHATQQDQTGSIES